MNKRQVISSLNKIAEELDNNRFYTEASTITNVMKKLAGLRVIPRMESRSGDAYVKQLFKAYDDAMAFINDSTRFPMNAKNAMSTVENLKLQAANDDSLMGNDKNVVSSLGNQVVEYLDMHMQNPQNPLRM
jgi:hypothetical protein